MEQWHCLERLTCRRCDYVWDRNKDRMFKDPYAFFRCTKCGGNLDGLLHFCPNCGDKIRWPAIPECEVSGEWWLSKVVSQKFMDEIAERVRLTCPQCIARLQIYPSQVGEEVYCSICKHTFSASCVAAPEGGKSLSQAKCKEIFVALLDAQDHGMAVFQSRTTIAERFGVTKDQVRQIEQEGIARGWPPLGNG